MPRIKLYYITERHNPQLGTYYVACGPLTKTAARKMEHCLYGTNFLHSFSTEIDYGNRLKELRAKGERVQ